MRRVPRVELLDRGIGPLEPPRGLVELALCVTQMLADQIERFRKPVQTHLGIADPLHDLSRASLDRQTA